MTFIKRLNELLALPFLALVWVYKKVCRPLMPGSCRFHPSCGDFSHEALTRHGLVGGLALTFFRVVRCHPFHRGGVEGVPHRLTWRYFISRPERER